MKKWISLALALALCLCAACALAADFTLNGVTCKYEVTDEAKKEACITESSYSLSGSVEIPSQIDGYTVTAVGKDAFAWCGLITSLVLPESVTSIGYGAFSGCEALESVEILGELTDIGMHAFSHCSALTSVSLPEGMERIGKSMFVSCSSLKSITIPESVKHIDNYAFDSSGLETVDLPSGLESIGEYAFGGSELTSVTIPGTVKEIGNSAFDHCSRLTTVKIEEGVQRIGEWAFSWCTALKSVTLPSTLTRIANQVFNRCASLAAIAIPSGVKEIEPYSFQYCSALENLTLPEGLETIGESAFFECTSLKDLEIPTSVTKIGSSAFSCCNMLTDITIPENVQKIGGRAFDGVKNVHFLASEPPAIYDLWAGDSEYSRLETVIVPCGAVEAYQAALEEFLQEKVRCETHGADPCHVPPVEISAQVSGEGGSVSGGGKIEPGKEVTLIASAKEGYRFVCWQNENGEVVSDQAEYSFKAERSVKLTAVFEKLHTHAYTLMKDESGHWEECACGDKINAAGHIPGDAATVEKPQTCTACGYELAPVVVPTPTPAPTPAPDVDALPKTGDSSRLALWMLTLVLSGCLCVSLRRKAKQN